MKIKSIFYLQFCIAVMISGTIAVAEFDKMTTRPISPTTAVETVHLMILAVCELYIIADLSTRA